MAIPYIMIELDKPRKLRCTYEAADEIEQTLGVSSIVDVYDNKSHKDLIVVLQILLKQEDETFEIPELKKIANNAKGLAYIRTKVYEAITAGIVGEVDDDPNAETPTGTKK